MAKMHEYDEELAKLRELFKDVDDDKRGLIEGLMQDAAFLYAENIRLRGLIMETGMVKVHPTIPSLQKPTEAAKQYLKNINSYAVLIKTLNSILTRYSPEEEDLFDDWLKTKIGEMNGGV